MDDLGGLGAKEGPGVRCIWTAPGVWGALLPWLSVAILLGLPVNRQRCAWWILIPLAGVTIPLGLLGGLEGLGSALVASVIDGLAAGAFGLAAVWLLAPWLARENRFLTWLCVGGVMAVFGGLALLFRVAGGGSDLFDAVASFVTLAFEAGLVSFALVLAGWLCRRRYRAALFTLCFLVALTAAWTVLFAPMTALAMVASEGELPGREILLAWLVPVLVTFTLVLPFLLLAYTNRFYHERFRLLFPMGDGSRPELPAAPQPPPPEATSSL